ncbi:subtilisin [Arthrobacter sp. V4I6]|uniref:S8 family serine peptidase n=1 Tax=Arthrobacter sp. V4I6 TaxID=3042281 RepID=UPI002782D2F5|nr:S8 family serine peptidase [Arthrobacter sp. V4I6]MDQ0853816.1 subtilisin [Arthrobacter sp. V4I6]
MLGILAAMALALGGGVVAAAPSLGAGAEQSYIVVLKDTVPDAGAVAAAHQGKYGFTAARVYRHAVSGYAGTMTASEAQAVAIEPDVEFVTMGRTFDTPNDPVPSDAEVAPFWWLRIGGTVDEARNKTVGDGSSGDAPDSVDVNVAVIDSGIDGAHPDLNVRGGVDCSTGTPVAVSPIDKLGHGTAVAGIIGARNNNLGIIGTAPGTPLWSVRVVDDYDVITEESLICAIDWVTSTRRDDDGGNDIEVANISIGGPGSDTADCGRGSDPMHYAICRSVRAGVAYAVAAGNAGADIAGTVPAAYREVLTATAMADFDGRPGGVAAPVCGPENWADVGQRDDQPAFFSNFATRSRDKRHTVAAPGVCMLSTAPGGHYGVNHGTSFASPAVAGSVARCISQDDCRGSGKDVMEDFLDRAENFNKRDHDHGFDGDPIRPKDKQYYGYLTQLAKF